VLIHTSGNRQHVIAASVSARGCGIRPGLTLAQARALCANVVAREHDPLRDARALEALGRWMMRFTPTVCLPRPDGEDDHQEHGLLLDITGCERVFGDFGRIAQQVAQALAGFGIAARLAIAPTFGAAWALTFGPANGSPGIISPDKLAEALTPLPPRALRLSDEVVASLHHLGIETIGQLMRLPRDQLPARFGDQLLLRLDQAMGRLPEPIVPLEHHDPVQTKMEFDGPVSSLEAVWHVFRHLIAQVIAQLARRGCGARRLDLRLLRDHAPPIEKTILLSRPSRDPANLFNLFRCALEGPEFAGLAQTGNAPDGFVGLHLRVPLLERIGDEQVTLIGHETSDGQRETDDLVERLSARLGSQAVAQAVLVESHIPERVCSWHGRLDAEPSRRPTRQRQADLDQDRHPPPRLRPLHLFAQPLEVGVTVCPSHDRDGRPVQFRGPDGSLHRLVHAVGPERIAGQWWSGHGRTRDYFDIEDDVGRRFWIFRVMENGRWFMQGQYE
jgi:protein ImuB